MLPYSEAMGPDNLDTRMRGCWDISPVSRETISSWAWQNARSNLWSKYRFWKSRLSIGDNERTIETGCGHGKFSLALGLSGAQVTLLDYNAAAVSAAVEVHRKIGLEPTAILGDLLNLPKICWGHLTWSAPSAPWNTSQGKTVSEPLLLAPPSYGRAASCFSRFQIDSELPTDWPSEPASDSVCFHAIFTSSRSELLRISKACEMKNTEVEGIIPLTEDFDNWIGENFRSLLRKLGIAWSRQPDQTPPEPEEMIERLKSSSAPLALGLMARRFTYSLLCVGVKPAQSD